MRRRLAIALVLMLLAVAAGIGGATLPRPDSVTPSVQAYQPFDPELARAYVDAGCWRCHAVTTLRAELERSFGTPATGAHPMGPDLAGIGGLYPQGWHLARLWRPQDISPHSQMPEHRQMFNPDGTPLPLASGAIAFMQTLKAQGRQREAWPDTRLELAHDGDTEHGRKLFAEFCAGCHGQSARGDGPAARWFTAAGDKPPANIAGGKMVWRSLRAPLPSHDDLYTTISNGLAGSGMPAFARTLTPVQRADLVAFITGLNHKAYHYYAAEYERGPIETKAPPINAALVKRGETLFHDEPRYACLDCHGSAGAGGGKLEAETVRVLGFRPRKLAYERLRRGGLEGVYTSIALGLGAGMAGYLEAGDANSADIWALAAYVMSLTR